MEQLKKFWKVLGVSYALLALWLVFDLWILAIPTAFIGGYLFWFVMTQLDKETE